MLFVSPLFSARKCSVRERRCGFFFVLSDLLLWLRIKNVQKYSSNGEVVRICMPCFLYLSTSFYPIDNFHLILI